MRIIIIFKFKTIMSTRMTVNIEGYWPNLEISINLIN